ncbi:MAG: hypothetical protein P4L83_21015 [Nevskia sp.]|nr:hypothetical protein [Nevskia sp.]
MHTAPRSASDRRARLAEWIGEPRHGLLLVLLLAAAARVTAMVVFPSLYGPDENFQFLEAAHRIAFGYGIKTWEFVEGLRSLLLPTLFAKLLWLADQAGVGPEGYILIAHLLLGATSLIGVAAVYRMGLRSGPAHALLAGLVSATWFELVYFSFRPLNEAIACDFLLVALALGSAPATEYTRRRLLAIGFCLGLCLMLRLQLLPGLGLAMLWIGRLRIRTRWLPMILGALLPVCVFGLYDRVTWGQAFHSYVTSYRANILLDVAAKFGTEPFYWYPQSIAAAWAGALPLLLALLALRLRSSALWLLVAAAILASHSLIQHKEARYVLPAIVCLVVVAAMGSADLVERARTLLGERAYAPCLAGAAVFWLATSASLAFAPGFGANWFRARDLLQVSYWLNAQPGLCGLMLYDRNWYDTGGYAYLHRNVPIYSRLLDKNDPPDAESAYNFVLLDRKSLPRYTAPFGIDACFGERPDDLCLISRPGNCQLVDDLRSILDKHRRENSDSPMPLEEWLRSALPERH